MSTATIDTVGFTFPITDHDEHGATVTVTGAGTPVENRTWRRKLPHGGFIAGGVGTVAWVEASLPKRYGGDNVAGLDVAQAQALLEDLYQEATQFAQPAATGQAVEHLHRREGFSPGAVLHRGWQDCNIKRLDVVRDFNGVTAISSLLDGLATIRQSGRAKVRRFADSERGAAETLRVGPKAWAATLYDKHAEDPRNAEPGRLRFEYRARDTQLKSATSKKWGTVMQRLSDLDQTKLDTLGYGKFREVGYDREVVGTAQLAAAVNASGLSPNDRRNLVGYLACRALGVDPGGSRNTELKYRNLASQLGIVVTERALEDTTTVALDYEAGTQTLAAAA